LDREGKWYVCIPDGEHEIVDMESEDGNKSDRAKRKIKWQR
jgi:hypothetical protein